MFEVMWVVLPTALVAFFSMLSYRLGYRAGATRVLNEWKSWLRGADEDVK